MNPKNKGFVAVHVGAGYHSPANSDLYRHVCKVACHRALQALKEGQSALVAAREAIMCLEDSPYTNAGTGSNLTINGQVECDASIMDGQSLQYGAVGAVSGVKNPILIAESLVFTQLQGVMSLGRIPPSTLAGVGAFEWAVKHGIATLNANGLVTEASRRAYIKHKRKLDLLDQDLSTEKCFKVSKVDITADGKGDENSADGQSDNRSETGRSDSNTTSSCTSQEARVVSAAPGPAAAAETEEASRLLDTVGAVVIDEEGHIASAVSSGGIVLKQPGRLGQAALYGCGCWAENYPENKAVGVSTSGCGEQLSKTLLARECASSLQKHDNGTEGFVEVFRDKFLHSYLLRDIDQKLGGALAVKAEDSGDGMQVELLWGHTTDSMCLGYMAADDTQASAFISRLPEGKRCGRTFVVQNKVIHL